MSEMTEDLSRRRNQKNNRKELRLRVVFSKMQTKVTNICKRGLGDNSWEKDKLVCERKTLIVHRCKCHKSLL